MKKEIMAPFGASEIQFTTGQLANQANGAVIARHGDTVVLATAVMSTAPREGIDFFPLLVDYEERLYAAGKIKGSRWMKREGRASDSAILKGRVIDRTLRPLFPSDMRNDVQIVCTILSVDGEHEPDMLAVNAAAMALAISNVPFDGPVAAVRVGRIENQLILNPTTQEIEKSDLDLIVSGTGEHILMVEAGSSFVTEGDMSAAIEFAQQGLAEICSQQTAWQQQIGHQKAAYVSNTIAEDVSNTVAELLTSEKIDAAYYTPIKADRELQREALFSEIISAVESKLGKELENGQSVKKAAFAAIDTKIKKYIQKQILEHGRRVDGRALNETRQITAEVGILPRTHGSALFTRGETQVLSVVTLGGPGDEQTLDGIEDPVDGTPKRYIHHYNMAGFSVGEVAPIRGPGRREVGHGALAERALLPALPNQESFPYTMRLVSETMSSNGSTSMASTCGSSLALMDAGVPITTVIGGCAMGLVLDEANPTNFKVLTDIAGIEDFNGHMDFKVTGNETGITALQLDIKVKGLTADILKQALAEAKPARLHILEKMKAALSAPRPELSPFAPRITSFSIDPEKIRDVIGSGGKTINQIIADCPGVKIDIEDSGLVMITSTDAQAAEKAGQMIKDIVREVTAGEEFEGTVTRLMDFGAFVEVLPGKEGLVHISQLANYRVDKVTDVVTVGDKLKVKVSEIDSQGRINLTHLPFAAPAPAGSPARFERSERPGGSAQRQRSFNGNDQRRDNHRTGAKPSFSRHGQSEGRGHQKRDLAAGPQNASPRSTVQTSGGNSPEPRGKHTLADHGITDDFDQMF